MPKFPIDLRSDTVTKPTAAMRVAIAEADVGDDVIDVDPTVEALQRRTAEMLGKEAAIFMPSGSMTNQVAIRVHCQQGDEFLCDDGCHIYNYEQGAFAQLRGVVARTVRGEFGVLRLGQLEDLVRPDNDHHVHTRLISIENTHNRGGGRIQPYDEVVRICEWAHSASLQTHLDGARLFNAVVATGISAAEWSQHFDTVSICFSKGLGAPVGSALAGTAAHIREARRHRKVLGGGMRQAGIIAAGALYALNHHVERLAEDHKHAQILADAVRDSPGLHLQPPEIDTNILIFHVHPRHGNAHEFVQQLRERGVWMLPISRTTVRAVTHLDVSRDQVVDAGNILRELTAEFV